MGVGGDKGINHLEENRAKYLRYKLNEFLGIDLKCTQYKKKLSKLNYTKK